MSGRQGVLKRESYTNKKSQDTENRKEKYIRNLEPVFHCMGNCRNQNIARLNWTSVYV